MTPEQQSIKSILAILDGADTDGSPVGDARQSHSFVIAEALRSICKFNGAETGDKMPFGDLREDITHNSKSECFNNATCETSNEPQEVWMKCIATVDELRVEHILHNYAQKLTGKTLRVEQHMAIDECYIAYNSEDGRTWTIDKKYFTSATPEDINNAKEKANRL